uniref:Uncharacterized protein n=1 Tax=Vitis vinifera TaxID=29760 RepID=A5BV31_VITVI|nr:hypothetical protein VITISV_020086 [Vitis vinifera]
MERYFEVIALTDEATKAEQELRRHGVQDLTTTMAGVESLMEYKRGDFSKPKPQSKVNHAKGGKDKGSRGYTPKERSSKTLGGKDGKGKGKQKEFMPRTNCFLCDGPHWTLDYAKRKALNAMIGEKEKEGDAHVGSLQLLNTLKAKPVPKTPQNTKANPPFHRDTSAAIPLGRHPIFSGCLTAAIPPGYLNRHSTRPTSHFLWMSHSRHSTQIPQSSFYPNRHPTSTRMSHSRHSIRPMFYLIRMSHSRHFIRPTFHLLRIFHTRHLPPDGRGGRFNFQLSLQIKMSFKLKHLTVEHSCSELVPSIQNFPASLHGNLAIYTFSSVCFFDWELIVLN